ncbi:MAG: dihydropteroate synthase [Desulfovibrio sp.]|nr:dihydropteroate synthase [Desulfovibrio sp.]
MTPWQIRSSRTLELARPFGIMGILNLTPDSFYDGSQYNSLPRALAQCGALLRDGSDIIDVGAESTRPGATAIAAQTECDRLLAALQTIRKEYAQAVISVDTTHALTAAQALQAGCDIINDVSACSRDDDLLDVVADFKPGYVLTHSQAAADRLGLGAPQGDITGAVLNFFERQLARLTSAGLPEANIVLDPGIGFGKTAREDIELMRHADQFLQFGRPLLYGISMKSFFAQMCGLSPNDRGQATATTCALLFTKGVTWHRVHHPAEAATALTCARELQE